MPRVHTRTKAARGKPYTCSRCGQPIEPGQEFYYWDFRYGGTRRIHKDHGYPRPSQLTQSAMGEVYAAIEAVEDLIADVEWSLEDATQAVQDVYDIAEQVKSQYEEAAEHFGNAGPSQERADELEGWMDQVESLDLSEWEDAATREASGEALECEECSGHGRVTCADCEGGGEVGTGVMVPILVDGKPEYEEEMIGCDVCAGEGEVECPECNGTGEQPEGDEEPGAWRDDAKAAIEEALGGTP